MSPRLRIMKVPSETYVYAQIDPSDSQATAGNVMLRLAAFRSFTYLYPYEEVEPEALPAEARLLLEPRPEAVSGAVADEAAEEAEEPINLRFPEGVDVKAGEWLCRLPSATYVAVDAPVDDVEATWRAVKAQLAGRDAVSLGEPDVFIVPMDQAPEDVHLWVIYGAADRAVVPLWPEEAIDDPEKAMAWRNTPATLEEPQPYRGAYVRVVAVYPEHVRGMQCRRWHVRRDEKPGIGTVRGKYPVAVAVSVPSPTRTPHIHSFEEIRPRDWRPGLVFYDMVGDDGCPISYLGDRLDGYCSDEGWVDEPTWRSWLGTD